MQGTLNVSPITDLHGLFFYGWTALYLAQAWLVRDRKLTRHRELGVIGVSLATGMCFVGLAAAIGTLKKFEPASQEWPTSPSGARAFSAAHAVTGEQRSSPSCVAVALAKVKQPEVHKRLLLVATVSLLNAAVGRRFAVFLAPPIPDALQGAIGSAPGRHLVDACPGRGSADCRCHDSRQADARPGPSCGPIAGGALVAVQVLRVPLSRDPRVVARR